MTIETKSKVQEILELTKSGFNNKEIAEKLSVNIPAIRYWQKKFGIKAKSSVNKLTEEQKKQVLNLYEEHKNALLVAELVGSTQYLVLSYLKEIGVDTLSKFFKGELAKFAIEQYNSGMTQEEIAEYHGCERQAVQTLFERAGIKGRTQLEQKQITWPVNQNAFTDWSDEETLFYYGLLLSDGCLLDNNSISITLKKSDKHILDSFAGYMKSSNAVKYVKKDKSCCDFRFRDYVVANNLRNAGMASRKSSKEVYPECVDRSNLEIARHFWRGYICGDGSVRSYNNLPRLHICGSKEICEEFKSFCESVLGYKLKSNICLSKDKRENRTKQLYYFRTSGRKARDVSLFMFENSKVFINRKYEDVMNFKKWSPKPKRDVLGVYERGSKFCVVFYPYGGNKPVAVFNAKDEAIEYRLKLELEYYGHYKSLS